MDSWRFRRATRMLCLLPVFLCFAVFHPPVPRNLWMVMVGTSLSITDSATFDNHDFSHLETTASDMTSQITLPDFDMGAMFTGDAAMNDIDIGQFITYFKNGEMNVVNGTPASSELPTPLEASKPTQSSRQESVTPLTAINSASNILANDQPGKRKASDEDKTELETTPPKRLCLTPNTSIDILQFRAQLVTDSSLTDDVLEFVTRVLRAEHPSTKMVILDPLWFQGDAAEPLPIHSANLQKDGATYCFPIHHGRAQHWTLGSFQIEHAAKRVSVRFYDSLDCDECGGG